MNAECVNWKSEDMGDFLELPREGRRWVEPLDDFDDIVAPEFWWEGSSDDGGIELGCLPPGVGGVLEFNLDDGNDSGKGLE